MPDPKLLPGFPKEFLNLEHLRSAGALAAEREGESGAFVKKEDYRSQNQGQNLLDVQLSSRFRLSHNDFQAEILEEKSILGTEIHHIWPSSTSATIRKIYINSGSGRWILRDRPQLEVSDTGLPDKRVHSLPFHFLTLTGKAGCSFWANSNVWF